MHTLYNEPCKICGSKNNYLIENNGRKSLFCEDCNNFEDIYVSDKLKQYWEEQAKVEEQVKIKQAQNIPKCPTCQSTNIKRVSGTSKAVSVAMFGLLSQKVKKQFHCNNCGYEW